ncbi:pancreatic lipase-related protein 2-like [Arctopsyche grandis]|uniref:pancreatic lipase-related protein 2-like n=1 Tax=Arctopsyche grandis TaxID=121162 RepID=UPI00406D9F68
MSASGYKIENAVQINSISILSIFEETVVRKMVSNCTMAKQLTSADYNSLKLTAEPKIKTMSFTHYVGNEEIIYPFDSAASAILSSPKYNRKICKSVKNAGLDNVFSLDHSVMMSDSYFTTSTNSQIVGEALGGLLAKLYAGGIRKFYLVGHSLGAHASGFAGKTFLKLTGVKLDRITGLDPAGPCFVYEPSNLRLDSTDANFVDIIHTNMYITGLSTQIGHVDFYPDGGSDMAGCFLASCSHLRSGYFFAESVYNNKFLAVKCDNWNTFKSKSCSNNIKTYMGYWTPTDVRGKYYLTTNMLPWYAKDTNGI